MAKKFTLNTQYRGYVNKPDITNILPGFLVRGSQNVISKTGGRVGIREGYSTLGDTGAGSGIIASYDWERSNGTFRNLRGNDTALQYYYSPTDTWIDLVTSPASSRYQFAEYWDDVQLTDALLFVNGESEINYWSGAITTFDSAGAATITKEGATTWAEEGFTVGGTTTVVIGGITYTYTGGEATTTLTGVTPNPTLGGHVAGDVVHQGVETTLNSALAGTTITERPDDNYENDLIGVLYNQVYIGSLSSRFVYVSQVNDYQDFNFASPRQVGQGARLTLDGRAKGFVVQENQMYMSAGRDQWYQTRFDLSADLTKEILQIERLDTVTEEGAIQQSSIAKIKNSIVYISNEPTLTTLSRIKDLATPQTKNISDPVKIDFDAYDFTDAHILYYKYNIYIAVPKEGLVLIYNIAEGFWESPQTIPAGRLAIIDSELHFHSASEAKTYLLFDGTFDDNGNPIPANAVFSYQQYGERSLLKQFNEWYTEGYMSEATNLNLILRYGINGCEGLIQEEILGTDSVLFCPGENPDNSLGKFSLGKQPLGSVIESDVNDENLPPKFRHIRTGAQPNAHEFQIEYSTNDTGQDWQLLAYGPAVSDSFADDVAIKR